MRFPKIALLILLLVPVVASAQAQKEKSWIDSPEAYFATAAERREWATLRGDAERDSFRQRYWARRDPTPNTPKNEFREVILARIKQADQKFQIEKTPGSETARGFVHVVFGSPSRMRTDAAPRAPAPAPQSAGSIYQPQTLQEIGESTFTWIYDRERTPRLLEMLGLPSLTVTINHRPQHHIDEIMEPGLVMEMRDKLAQRSIVNEIAGAGTPRPATIAPARIGASLADPIRALLDVAPAPSFASPAGVFGHHASWAPDGSPLVTIWLATPPEAPAPPAGARFVGRVVESGNQNVVTFSEPLRASEAFGSFFRGNIYSLQFPLAPGDYRGSFALVDSSGDAIASAAFPIQARNGQKALALSSLLLSGAPGVSKGGFFDLGQLGIIPRADATFSRSESLWYFGQVANPSDPARVQVEIRVRGPKSFAPISVNLEGQELPGRRFLFGRELPLASFEPGDYTIYAVVRDEAGNSDVRRADFRVVP